MARIRGIGTAQHARRRAIRPLRLDPLIIFGADLELWLRSDLGITLNGTDVSAWADQSGKGHDFSQGTALRQPVFNAVDANWAGKPSLGFDATPLWLDSDDAASVWKFLHDGTGGGALAVYRFNSTTTATLLATALSNTQIGVRLRAPQTGNQRLALANGSGSFVLTNAFPPISIDTNYYGFYAWEDGRPGNEWIHGVINAESTGSTANIPTGADPTNTFRLGASVVGTQGLLGELLEVIAFSIYPSAQQFTQLKAYLYTRYGLS